MKPLSLAFARGLLTCALAFNTGLISKYSTLGGVSPSVLMSMVSLTSFTTALVFYVMYQEKLYIRQMIGMALIVFSVIVISLGKNNMSGGSTRRIDDSVYIGIGLVMMQCIIFTICQVLLRQYV